MPKLLPLEYCKLDRAATLLGCEVEDLIHWGSIGAINLCIKDPGVASLLVLSMLGEPLDCADSATFKIDGDGELSPQLSDYSRCATDAKSSDDQDSVLLTEICKYDAYLYGLWAFSYLYDNDLTSGIKRRTALVPCFQSDESYEIYAVLKTKEELADHTAAAWLGLDDDDFSDFTINDLWVVRPDLEKLYDAIHGDGKLPNMFNDPKAARKISKIDAQIQSNRQKPHHRSESTAINREQVLAAAVNVRENYPDECQGFSKWAQAVVNHSRIYWPELDEPPLTLEKIERIIASAMNNGKPDKKN
jgi:hypothetical protein